MKNYSLAVFLLGKATRAMLCSYVPLDENGQPVNAVDRDNSRYKTMFKTVDPDLKPGDYVVVPTSTRHGMTVCKIEDADVQIDLNSSTQVDWIIGKISLADHTELKVQEEAAIKRIKDKELEEERARVAKQFFGEDPSKFADLEFAQKHGGMTIEHKPVEPAST